MIDYSKPIDPNTIKKGNRYIVFKSGPEIHDLKAMKKVYTFTNKIYPDSEKQPDIPYPPGKKVKLNVGDVLEVEALLFHGTLKSNGKIFQALQVKVLKNGSYTGTRGFTYSVYDSKNRIKPDITAHIKTTDNKLKNDVKVPGIKPHFLTVNWTEKDKPDNIIKQATFGDPVGFSVIVIGDGTKDAKNVKADLWEENENWFYADRYMNKEKVTLKLDSSYKNDKKNKGYRYTGNVTIDKSLEQKAGGDESRYEFIMALEMEVDGQKIIADKDSFDDVELHVKKTPPYFPEAWWCKDSVSATPPSPEIKEVKKDDKLFVAIKTKGLENSDKVKVDIIDANSSEVKTLDAKYESAKDDHNIFSVALKKDILDDLEKNGKKKDGKLQLKFTVHITKGGDRKEKKFDEVVEIKLFEYLKLSNGARLPIKPGTSYSISSGMGWRPDGNGGQMWHEGLDIEVPVGTPVVAIEKGTVVNTTTDNYGDGYGNLVCIKHSNNVYSLVAHNSNVLVNIGEQIEAGQPIASSGNTGTSTGPHIHYELIQGTANDNWGVHFVQGRTGVQSDRRNPETFKW